MDPSPPLPVNREGRLSARTFLFSILNYVQLLSVFDTICYARYIFDTIYKYDMFATRT